jgi:hypothetical protein
MLAAACVSCHCRISVTDHSLISPVTPLNERTGWTRHFVYRTERTRTTWKLRLVVVALVAIGLWATQPWWTSAVGRSLVCDPDRRASDAILVENFDTDYLVFEEAANLRRAGFATRVLVPVLTAAGRSQPFDVDLGTAELMARIARLGAYDVVPIAEVEPISLNAARDVLRFVQREHIRSVIVVSPLFRSRRSALVYAATLDRAGISVSCQPARSPHGVDTWFQSWHGIENALQQWVKLQYYRLYVLPFIA